ncbi:DUF1289 domain-containing protein [Paraglaciecola hydrolytica]|uniref:DUF1289 domain-containing protein n=1 Tax=Paraglaciecola hydrolytica TaxID=1799789 RepID=UPI0009EA81AC|nr:DUF1289 domain-containing protein [Paraglaciecola hydrolytica]
MHKVSASIESPCIRNCCLNNEDVCLGCFRTLNEILQWSELSSETKQQVLTNCLTRKHLNQQLSLSRL